jgi:hypothetical protein
MFKKVPSRLFDRRARGWSFSLGPIHRHSDSREHPDTRIYLIVLDGGSASMQKSVVPPDFVQRAEILASLDARQLRKVVDHVLSWTGAELAFSPTMKQRYLVEFDGKAVRPAYDQWSADYDRATSSYGGFGAD